MRSRNLLRNQKSDLSEWLIAKASWCTTTVDEISRNSTQSTHISFWWLVFWVDVHKKSRDFWTSLSRDHMTTGPSRSLDPVLSRPVWGPSWDFLGWDSPATITSGQPPFNHYTLLTIRYGRPSLYTIPLGRGFWWMVGSVDLIPSSFAQCLLYFSVAVHIPSLNTIF